MSNKKKISKKNLILKITGGMLGFCAVVYLFLVVYTNYISPPRVGDGLSSMTQWQEMRRNETMPKE